ncbi:hypothetical protein [Maribacter sp. 2304DJ31-5]|uniref:hypothetical protein n=1 Tax=Maribacter sp. 2304DJ31-5 TaxID=3386273 RepID=UPI0039BD0A51
MKDLKSIWNTINDIQLKKVEFTDVNKSNDIFSRLEKEEKLRKSYFIWIILLVLTTMSFFSWIIYDTSGVFGLNQGIGVCSITVGSILIVYLAQLVKIPLNEYRYQQTSIEFLLVVKEKLSKRRRFLIGGISLQLIFLIIGLHLLIFPNFHSVGTQAALGLYYGTMLALAGSGIGITVACYNAYYKPILERIKVFLNE